MQQSKIKSQHSKIHDRKIGNLVQDTVSINSPLRKKHNGLNIMINQTANWKQMKQPYNTWVETRCEQNKMHMPV